MITNRIGNLLEQPDIDVIVHQANIYHIFGAGIAKAILNKFPYAHEADCYTEKGSKTKIGSYSVGIPMNENEGPVVINLYSQIGLSPSHTSYDAMFEGLNTLRNCVEVLPNVKRVGIPFQMGCGLADGNWEIVKVIIEQAFEGSDIEVVIVKLPEADLTNPEKCV